MDGNAMNSSSMYFNLSFKIRPLMDGNSISGMKLFVKTSTLKSDH